MADCCYIVHERYLMINVVTGLAPLAHHVLTGWVNSLYLSLFFLVKNRQAFRFSCVELLGLAGCVPADA